MCEDRAWASWDRSPATRLRWGPLQQVSVNSLPKETMGEHVRANWGVPICELEGEGSQWGRKMAYWRPTIGDCLQSSSSCRNTRLTQDTEVPEDCSIPAKLEGPASPQLPSRVSAIGTGSPGSPKRATDRHVLYQLQSKGKVHTHQGNFRKQEKLKKFKN